MDGDEPGVPRYEKLSYSDFLRWHLIPNEPLLLGPDWSSTWWARQTLVSSHGQPDWQNLRRYGDMIVPVAYTAEREFSEFRRSEMPLGDVLDLWCSETEEGKTMYIKDWQLSKELVKRGLEPKENAYEIPEIFRDDWMTPRLRDTTTGTPEDFRFTYMGPCGTFTPLHADVYNSYSWSTNLCGRKKWWLFRPGTQPDGFDVRTLEDTGAIELVQMPGETIFVPSGWWHQVVNLDFCVSVNQNWFNSITLPSVFDHLVRNQARVEESILDVKDMLQLQHSQEEQRWRKEWAEAVQELLERDAGWNWVGFWSCVADNLEAPPAPPELSPPRVQTLETISVLLRRFLRDTEHSLIPNITAVLSRVSHYCSIDATT